MTEPEHTDVLIVGGQAAGAPVQVQIEHEDVTEHGGFVARQWLGEDEPHSVPCFFDLVGRVSMESLTLGRSFDRVVVASSLDEDAFAVWMLRSDTPLRVREPQRRGRHRSRSSGPAGRRARPNP